MRSWPRQAWWELEKSTWPHAGLSRFVESGGLRWHVQMAGHGPPLLLVHGTGASSHSWRDLIPRLAERFTVIAPDLPGHAFTEDLPRQEPSIEGMSRALGALLRSLSCRPEFCVAHSAGAVVLTRMALDQSIRPRLIVGINGAFLPLQSAMGRLFSPLAKILAASPWVPRVVARQGGNASSVARVLAGTGSRLTPRGIDLYARLVSHPEHVAGTLRMMSNWDLKALQPALARLEVPLVLIVGENDKTVPPAQSLELQRRLRHARVVRLPRLGHLAHEEAPELVVEEILKCCELPIDAGQAVSGMTPGASA